MLSVFLACEDPYEVARFLVEKLSWRLEEQYLPAASRERRGAGVTVYLRVDGIDGIWTRHQAAGVTTTTPSLPGIPTISPRSGPRRADRADAVLAPSAAPDDGG
jgi:hypothetical protein